VRGCVRTQHEILVHVVTVRDRPSGVVQREREIIEVLSGRDERGGRRDRRVGREMGFDDLFERAERVGGLAV
jgi:hypothetical protein